jgi:hypothetical protein
MTYNQNNNRFTEQADGYTFNKIQYKAPRNAKDEAHKAFRAIESIAEYVDNTRHPDGCFQCPRCKHYHFVVDNYDLLCDPCATIVLVHPKAKPSQVEGIKRWKLKAKAHWSGTPDLDIEERLSIRDRLSNRDN